MPTRLSPPFAAHLQGAIPLEAPADFSQWHPGYSGNVIPSLYVARQPVFNTPLNEVAFVLDNVADWQVLAENVRPGVEVVVIDSKGDGLSQMANWLAQKPAGSVETIHILSHGAEGSLNFGSVILDSAHLESYKNDLQTIGQALTTQGDIKLYGCYVATGDSGEKFIDSLAAVTGADVAASDDATGAAELGGDWSLEIMSGVVAGQPLYIPTFNYKSILASPWVLNGGDSIYVRPGGTSFTWTYGTGNMPGQPGVYTITSIDYHNADFPPTGIGPEDWILTRGKFQYSTDSGNNWVDYAYPATGSTNFVTTAGKIWRFVDNMPVDTTTSNSIGNAWMLENDFPGQNVGGGSNIIPDNAPTDIKSNVTYFLSDGAQGQTVATLTPTDTGATKGGYWQIDSQSDANLFTISSNPATGNTATLSLGSGSLPAIGQTATVTARYYDLYQTDSSGNPLNGQGFSKQLTYTVIDAQSKDLNFGTDLKVSTTTSNAQTSPAITTLSNGNFVAVWQSAGQGGESVSNNGIYGQMYAATGVAIGSEFAITATNNGINDINPAVSALNDGRFVVAYATTPGANSQDIAYRIIEANGTVGNELIANTSVANKQSSPSVTTLTDGSFVIAWADYASNGSAANIRAQKFDAATGAKSGLETGFTASGLNISPSVAALSDGNYAVTWADGASFDVKAAISTSPSSVINVTATGNASSNLFTDGLPIPRIAGLNGGGFVVTWSQYDTNWERTDIAFQRYDNSGAAQGSTTLANVSSSKDSYKDLASVAALSGGGFVVAWQSNTDDYDLNGIFGRRFTSTGTAVEANEFEINQYRRGDQNSPAITALASDLFATVWVDNTSDTSSEGIEARVLLPEGPVVSSISRVGAQTVLVATTSIDYTVTFSESVTGVDASDFTLTSSGSAGGTISSISGSGNTYTVTVNTLSGEGTLRLDLKTSGTGIKNGTNADITGGFSGGQTYTVDRVAPNAPAIPDMTAGTDSGSSSLDNVTSNTTPAFTGTAETGTTVQLYDGATLVGSATASGGNWTISSSVLGEGSHTLTAKATDAAGNTGSASGSLTITIDTTAPTSLALSSTNALRANTGVNTAIGTLSATDSQSISYALATGSGGNDSGNSSFNINGNSLRSNAQLAVGSYNVYLSATDAAGNVSYIAKTITVTDAPMVSSISSATAAGSYKVGDTISIQLTFSEAVNVSGTPQLTLETGAVDRIAEFASGNGSNVLLFNYTVQAGDTSSDLDYLSTTALVLNGGSITAVAGGTSAVLTLPAPGSLQSLAGSSAIIIDTTAPTNTIGSLLLSADTGASSTDFITSATAQSISGTLAANLASGEKVQISTDNGQTWLDAAATVGQSTFSLAGQTLSGSNTLKVRVADTAGNTGITFSQAYVLDTTAPTNTIGSLQLSADTGASSTDFITSATTQSISGTLAANLVSGETVQVSLDNGLTWIDAAATVGQSTFSLAGQTLSGSNTLKVRVADTAGNTGTTFSQAYVLDTTAPANTVGTIQLSADTGVSSTDFITSTAAQSISGTLVANLVSGETVQVSLDNGQTWVNATTTVGQNTFSLAGLTLNGSDTLKVRVVDTAGNTGTTFSKAYALDITAPATPGVPDLGNSSDTGASSTDNITANNTPTFTGTGETNATIRLYDTDGTTLLGSTTADGSGNWSITSSPLADGSHTLTVKQTDIAGNASPASSSLTVRIDTLTPAAPATPALSTGSDGGIIGDFLTNISTPVITGTAEANATIRLFDTDGTTLLGTTTADGSGNWSITSSLLADGSHSLTVKQTDLAGNMSTASSALTINIDSSVPSTPGMPTLDIASDSSPIGDNLTSVVTPTVFGTGTTGNTVTLYDTNGTTVLGTAVVDGSGNWRIASSALAEGVHNLTVKQANTAGAISNASQALSLTIDSLPPAAPGTPTLSPGSDSGTPGDAQTKVNTPVITGTGEANATVKLYDTDGTTLLGSTTVDGSGNWSITSSLLTDGLHNLTIKQTDAVGNVSPGSSLIVDIDTAAPGFIRPGGARIEVSKSLVVQFNETLSSLSQLDKVYLKEVAGQNLVAVTVSINDSGSLVLTPKKPLAFSTSYYVSWDAGALVDRAGNAVNALSSDNAINFATISDPTPPASDQDGVDDVVENDVISLPAANGQVVKGDGNGDGIADSLQTNVSSVGFLDSETAESNPGTAEKIYVTLVADSVEGKTDNNANTALRNVKQLDKPATAPADLSMPLGLIAFQADASALGASKSFSLYVDGKISVNGYWKQVGNDWVNLASAEFGGKIVTEGGKTRLDFTIEDGGRFDNDGKADGIITDPGAIGFRSTSSSGLDSDRDQFPDSLESANGLKVGVKDNDVFTNPKFFVMQLYRDTLFREAESDGLLYWQKQLDSGVLSRAQVTSAFLDSTEFQTGAGGISRLYLGALDRLPDNSGLNYWVEQFQQGKTLTQIATDFVNSTEFGSRFESQSLDGFVDRLYQNVLGRQADADGKTFWVQQLEKGQPKGNVLIAFTESAEYKQATDAKISIALDYLGLLDRAPEQAGFDYWLAQLQQGTAEIDIIQHFLSVQEYHARFLP